MTVNELMNMLKQMPGDAEITIWGAYASSTENIYKVECRLEKELNQWSDDYTWTGKVDIFTDLMSG